MQITINKIIEKEISNHPNLKWNDLAVKRSVKFLGYPTFMHEDEIVTLAFRVVNKLVENDQATWKTVDVIYQLRNDIYINITTQAQANAAELVRINGEIVTDKSIIPNEINYMSEFDYWFNLIANQPVPDRILIESAITNLDTYQHYFDTLI